MKLWQRDQDVLQDFSARLGQTALIEVPRQGAGARIVAKAEWQNPTGSIKDRAAYAMLLGLLSRLDERSRRELRLVEYSGGNLGVSLAALCADLEIPLTLVLGAWSEPGLVASLQAKGATVELWREGGFWGVMQRAVALAADDPTLTLFYQHRNENNVSAHKVGTGAEIVSQLEGCSPRAFVASVGTGGTLMGVHAALTETYGRGVDLHAVTPAELPYGSMEPPNAAKKYAGSGGLGCGRKQLFVARDEHQLTSEWTVSWDEAMAEVGRFYVETGLAIGSSSAANLIIARQVAERLGPSEIVVTVFPSGPTEGEFAEAIAPLIAKQERKCL